MLPTEMCTKNRYPCNPYDKSAKAEEGKINNNLKNVSTTPLEKIQYLAYQIISNRTFQTAYLTLTFSSLIYLAQGDALNREESTTLRFCNNKCKDIWHVYEQLNMGLLSGPKYSDFQPSCVNACLWNKN